MKNIQDGYPTYPTGYGAGRMILTAILGLLLLTGVVLGGHYAGWWLATDSAGRQIQLDQLAPGSQQAWADKLGERIDEVNALNVQLDAPSLTAAQKDNLDTLKAGLIHTACGYYAHLVTLPVSPDQANWKAANCTSS